MRTKTAEEPEVGDCYVSESKKLIRKVVAMRPDPDGVLYFWESYHLDTGEATGDGLCCTARHLLRWADRKATSEEIARLHGRPEILARQRESLQEIIPLVLRECSDADLLAEVLRRGLKS